MASQDATRFLANIDQLRREFQSFEVRVVGVRDGDGQLYLKGLNGKLRHEAPAEIPIASGPNGDGVWSHHAVLPPAALEALLSQADAGAIRLGGSELRFVERDDRPIHLSSFYQARLDSTAIGFGRHIIGVVTDSGRMPSTYPTDRTEALLRSQDLPWDGWADVSSRFLEFDAGRIGLEQGHPGRIAFEVSVPVGAHLSAGKVLAGRLELTLSVLPGVPLKRLRLALFAFKANREVERLQIPVEGRPDADGNLLLVTEMPAGMVYGTATLSHYGWDAGRVQIRVPGAHTPNPRMAQVRLTTRNMDVVRDGIMQERGRGIEPWVALLLYELGLSVARTDNMGIRDGAVDMIAMVPGQDVVLMVECCEAAPDTKGKLSKLAVRSHELSEGALQDVFPILFTRLSAAAIPQTERQMAGREGIALIASDDLPLLSELANENADAHRLLNFLEGRIPPNPDNKSPSWLRRRGRMAYL